MSITLTSRSAARKRLAELLDEVTTLVTVASYQSKTVNGSPMATVHSDGTNTQYPGYARERHRYIVSLLWDRETAATAEDGTDDLSQAVRQKLLDHATEPGYWDDLTFAEGEGEYSEMDYPMIDGRQYRRERFRVAVLAISAS